MIVIGALYNAGFILGDLPTYFREAKNNKSYLGKYLLVGSLNIQCIVIEHLAH